MELFRTLVLPTQDHPSSLSTTIPRFPVPSTADSDLGLINPGHSPLPWVSQLLSFPPLIDMLKFSGSSCVAEVVMERSSCVDFVWTKKASTRQQTRDLTPGQDKSVVTLKPQHPVQKQIQTLLLKVMLDEQLFATTLCDTWPR